ncbi:MAG: cysteine desulfurase NifS [Caldisericia bacterium]|nr:cysteine desulfurase NifS [Caldisericia bacterium]
MKKIYMDHSATTQTDPAVVEAMLPYLTKFYGNPSALYSIAEESKKAIDRSRETIASFINASPSEIIFTSCGTESDNQAIISIARLKKEKGNHIITTSIEHHAVLHTCDYLQKEGFEVTFLPVDGYGRVSAEDLKKAIKPTTILITIMHANNEVGTLQDIKTLSSIAHKNGILFHTDAVQSIGKVPVDVVEMGVDMLSSSAHKLYGPKGVGFLYVKKGVPMKPFMHGGDQERKLRAGTENVASIVGYAKAIELAKNSYEAEAIRLRNLSRYFVEELDKAVPDVVFTGHPTDRTPGHVSCCFSYIEGESVLLMLDSLGICVSSGSACTARSLAASHVLLAMGIDVTIAQGSIRFTLGHENTKDDIDYVLKHLPGIVDKFRKMSPLYEK